MQPAECFELMNSAEAVYLATVDDSGRPRIRALCNLRREERYPGTGFFCRRAPGFTVYFGTTASSGKVREILANPNVALYYCDPATFRGLMLAGRMEVLTDPGLRRACWQEEWRVYYPAGPEDPEWVVLRLQPETASGWGGAARFALDPR
jgi:general stress protein 26